MSLLSRSSVDFLRHFMMSYPRRTAFMIVLLILSGLAEGVGLVTLLPLLDLAVGTGGSQSSLVGAISRAISALGVQPSVGTLLALIVGAMALKGAFLWLAMRQVGYTVAQVATDLRLRLIRSLMQAEWSYFSKYPAGYLSNAISTEAHRASAAYRQACAALAGVVQAAIYATIVFLVSWQVAVLALAVGLVVLILLRHFVAMSRTAGHTQTELMKSLVGRLTDALPGIKAIKAMAREQHLLPMLEHETEGFNRAQQRQVLAVESLRAFQEPLLVLVISTGIYALATAGSQPLATLLVMAVLFYRFMQTVNHIQSQYQDMTANESALWSLQGHIDEAQRAREVTTGTAPPPPLQRGIRMESATFGYGETPVLEHVTVLFPAGKFIAIVGPSGSGKTTLVDLVVGLLKPRSGVVYLDDTPLADVDIRAWRRMIGYVPQEVLLLHGSIYANVTLGDLSISREQVEQALRRSGAWSFISQLPGGLDYMVGERGTALSGGQRQRIAIARALIGDPRLLILDEGTAALDPTTEAAICETLRGVGKTVTVIAISHQTAISEWADAVFEVSEGRVVRRKAPSVGIGIHSVA